MNLAPIIVFVYNRPEHLRKTLVSLQANNLANIKKVVIRYKNWIAK